MMSPWPDAVLPLVAAAEGLYLAGLTSRTEVSRSTLTGRCIPEHRKSQSIESQRTLKEMVSSLPPEARRRFENLRQRCVEMRAIAERRARPSGPAPSQDDSARRRSTGSCGFFSGCWSRRRR